MGDENTALSESTVKATLEVWNCETGYYKEQASSHGNKETSHGYLNYNYR